MSAPASWPVQAWDLLTAVPGRPAAKWSARCRRAIPLLLPLLALLALAGWKWGILDPRARAERAANQPLLNLEREVAALRLHHAEGKGGEGGRALALRGALPRGNAGVPAFLRQWQAEAASRGWEAAFGVPVGQPAGQGSPLTFVLIRAGLRPAPGNLHPWGSLMGLLGALSAPESRIEVTRLAIRADEQGRYSVETRLRTPYLADPQENAK